MSMREFFPDGNKLEKKWLKQCWFNDAPDSVLDGGNFNCLKLKDEVEESRDIIVYARVGVEIVSILAE